MIIYWIFTQSDGSFVHFNTTQQRRGTVLGTQKNRPPVSLPCPVGTQKNRPPVSPCVPEGSPNASEARIATDKFLLYNGSE